MEISLRVYLDISYSLTVVTPPKWFMLLLQVVINRLFANGLSRSCHCAIIHCTANMVNLQNISDSCFTFCNYITFSSVSHHQQQQQQTRGLLSAHTANLTNCEEDADRSAVKWAPADNCLSRKQSYLNQLSKDIWPLDCKLPCRHFGHAQLTIRIKTSIFIILAPRKNVDFGNSFLRPPVELEEMWRHAVQTDWSLTR